MAKFCGKCGSKLDKTTGLCPKCDADKIRKRKKRKILKRCIGLAAFLLLVCIGVTGVRVYLGKVNLPVFSAMVERAEKRENSTETERVIPETDMEGFSYYESSEQNIVKDEETEAVFVNNEILVTLVSENYKEQLQEYLHTIGGSIAGELPEVAEYQILLEEIHSYSELEQMIEDIQNHEWVLSASLNYAAPIDTSYTPNDEEWANEWEDVADGTNWGMEAIDAPGAWEYKDRLQEVRVGVFDDMFDIQQHEELKFAEEPYKNGRALKAVDNGELEWSDHGTHVSGTVAASFNNEKGVAGALPKVQLYGVSYFGMGLSGQFTTQEWKTGFYYLIVKKKCSVVNVSFGYGEMTFGASRGAKAETEALKEMSGELGKYLKILIDKKYSFVICKAAGNQNEAGDNQYRYFKKDDNDNGNEWTYYSYQKYIDYLDGKINDPKFENYRERRTEIESRLESGNVDAKYDILGAITEPDVEKRIIMVGAAQNLGTHKEGGFLGIGARKVHDGYAVARSSQCGERVDVIAPGVNIYSTIKNGYGEMSGTSQAAPHVTGVAGLVFAANPEVKAEDVKKIISDSAVGSYREEGYGMVNARNAVEMAFNYKAGETANTEENTETDSAESTTVDIYNMYAEKVREYEERYGEAEVRDDSSGIRYMMGLCFAKLVDFAGDGQKELLVVYADDWQEDIPENYTAEVWEVTDGQLVMLYSGEVCVTDGAFEYIELWTGSENSYLCSGGFGNEWYGFAENGQFTLVREETMRMRQSGGWIYEINGKEVSYEEFSQNGAEWTADYELNEYQLSNNPDSDKIFSEIEETKKELNME